MAFHPDRGEQLYIADCGNARVVVVDISSGKTSRETPSLDLQQHQLTKHTFVDDASVSVLVKASWRPSGLVFHVASSGQLQLFVSDIDTGDVHTIDPNTGETISTLTSVVGRGTSALASMSKFGSKDELWWVNPEKNVVGKISEGQSNQNVKSLLKRCAVKSRKKCSKRSKPWSSCAWLGGKLKCIPQQLLECPNREACRAATTKSQCNSVVRLKRITKKRGKKKRLKKIRICSYDKERGCALSTKIRCT